MRFVIVTNIPAPYRIPIYNILAKKYDQDFLVIYCAKKESNRKWELDNFKFKHVYLKEKVNTSRKGNYYIHNNTDVFQKLKKFKPDVIITTGYNPTHLYAWIYSIFHGAKHIPMTDGWLGSERDLSMLHRIIRKIVFATSRAFIGAGKKSIDLFLSYGVQREKIFQSHLCIDNDKFLINSNRSDRDYDIMFAGQFIERKLPDFFVQICRELRNKSGKSPAVLLIGNGPLKEDFLKAMDREGIDYNYRGFAQQDDLPGYYSNTKLFLFTTNNDPWGIVANEALASGTPVIVTPYAGVNDDLVIDKYNGYILDVDPNLWAEKVIEIINDKKKWNTLSTNASESVSDFNFSNAAKGIDDAVSYALQVKKNHE
ncbi:MAG: glycosyltransferase family 4 protein [Spirochaetes bacterium]|nr:glycosyltransferase family 4 protein [Spirochaetota bacterium]